MKAFVGIDVAFAKRKRLPISVCTLQGNRLIPLPLGKSDIEPPRGSGNVAAIDPARTNAFADETSEYLRQVELNFHVSIVRIAIDAPSAPRRDTLNRRASEACLGCSCFATPSASEFADKIERVREHVANRKPESQLPAANQLWMLVGFSLFERLSRSWECLEVYPQATMRCLNAATTHKSKDAGLEEQFHALSQYTGWQVGCADVKRALREIAKVPRHDALDAYGAAWIASLEEQNREALGDYSDDCIWLPKLGSLSTFGV